MKYAPKSKTYSKTLSLKVRVCIAASTNCTGHELFWKKVLQRMKLEMSSELQARLQYMDRMKENNKTERESTIASKNKRSKGKYEAIKRREQTRPKQLQKDVIMATITTKVQKRSLQTTVNMLSSGGQQKSKNSIWSPVSSPCVFETRGRMTKIVMVVNHMSIFVMVGIWLQIFEFIFFI
jgi:hypothetical protein